MIIRFKSTVLTTVFTLLICACAVSQAKDSASKAFKPFPNFASESAGVAFDADKIAALEARVLRFVADGDVKGIATLLVKNGKVISHAKAGVRHLLYMQQSLWQMFT